MLTQTDLEQIDAGLRTDMMRIDNSVVHELIKMVREQEAIIQELQQQLALALDQIPKSDAMAWRRLAAAIAQRVQDRAKEVES